MSFRHLERYLSGVIWYCVRNRRQRYFSVTPIYPATSDGRMPFWKLYLMNSDARSAYSADLDIPLRASGRFRSLMKETTYLSIPSNFTASRFSLIPLPKTAS